MNEFNPPKTLNSSQVPKLLTLSVISHAVTYYTNLHRYSDIALSIKVMQDKCTNLIPFFYHEFQPGIALLFESCINGRSTY